MPNISSWQSVLGLDKYAERFVENEINLDVVSKLTDEDLLDEIAAKTDGVPLFIEELIKAALDSGTTRIPASLHDSLTARLDRVSVVR